MKNTTFVQLRDSRTNNIIQLNPDEVAYISLGAGILLLEDRDRGVLSWEPDAAPKDVADTPVFSFYVYYRGRGCERFEYSSPERGLQDLRDMFQSMSDVVALPVWDLRFPESMVLVSRSALRSFSVPSHPANLRVRCMFAGFSHFFEGGEPADAALAERLLLSGSGIQTFEFEHTPSPEEVVAELEALETGAGD
jgi:hypothetical protein